MPDTLGIITSCNTFACRLFGYSSVELLKQNIAMLLPAPIDRYHDYFLKVHCIACFPLSPTSADANLPASLLAELHANRQRPHPQLHPGGVWQTQVGPHLPNGAVR